MMKICSLSIPVIVVVGVLACGCASPPMAFDPVAQDPPIHDKDFPTSFERVTTTSGGEQLILRMFVAQGAGPHATVLIARGFPDYLGSIDLALVLQRAGFNVLSFNYRGFWGSDGTYTMTNALRDVMAAIAAIRLEVTAKKMRVDPKRIILLGYSLGGPLVLRAGGDSDIRAVAVIDGTDPRDEFAAIDTAAGYDRAVSFFESSSAVRVASAKVVVDELRAQWSEWDPINAAPGLAGKDVLLLYAAKGNGDTRVKPALRDALAGKARLTDVTLDTDHSFLDHRVALIRAVLRWLGSLK